MCPTLSSVTSVQLPHLPALLDLITQVGIAVEVFCLLLVLCANVTTATMWPCGTDPTASHIQAADPANKGAVDMDFARIEQEALLKGKISAISGCCSVPQIHALPLCLATALGQRIGFLDHTLPSSIWRKVVSLLSLLAEKGPKSSSIVHPKKGTSSSTSCQRRVVSPGPPYCVLKRKFLLSRIDTISL